MPLVWVSEKGRSEATGLESLLTVSFSALTLSIERQK